MDKRHRAGRGSLKDLRANRITEDFYIPYGTAEKLIAGFAMDQRLLEARSFCGALARTVAAALPPHVPIGIDNNKLSLSSSSLKLSLYYANCTIVEADRQPSN